MNSIVADARAEAFQKQDDDAARRAQCGTGESAAARQGAALAVEDSRAKTTYVATVALVALPSDSFRVRHNHRRSVFGSSCLHDTMGVRGLGALCAGDDEKETCYGTLGKSNQVSGTKNGDAGLLTMGAEGMAAVRSVGHARTEGVLKGDVLLY
jgi:hypothetical protein